jgi:hypothetical protein
MPKHLDIKKIAVSLSQDKMLRKAANKTAKIK